MNYTINEIPDEAVELSGNEMIPIWQGETKKVSVATLASSGIPVGAVMPFANGTTSEDWLLCDGRDTTGTNEELATHYPALYTYLGNSNVLPAQFDHSKLSEWENITIPTTAETAITMEYDGFIYVDAYGEGAGVGCWMYVYVNGLRFRSRVDTSNNNYNAPSLMVPVKKGDVVYCNGQHIENQRVAYYKQNLYIKAT